MKTYEDFQKELDNIEYRTEQERMVEVNRIFNENRDTIKKEVTRRQLEGMKQKSILRRIYEFFVDITTIKFF